MKNMDFTDIIMKFLTLLLVVVCAGLLVFVIYKMVDEVFAPGCEYEFYGTVSVEIVDTEYHSSYTQPVFIGKTTLEGST